MSVKIVTPGGGGGRGKNKMCRPCKPVLDSDWLLRHVVVAPESPGIRVK